MRVQNLKLKNNKDEGKIIYNGYEEKKITAKTIMKESKFKGARKLQHNLEENTKLFGTG